MAGIDVAWHAKRALSHFREPSVRRPLVQDRLFEMGRLGQKTGKGWYRYDDARKASPDPEVIELIRSQAQQAGIPQRTVSDAHTVERMVYALINEGARALEEGCALRASDIDVIYVNGYGFPSWRGGPMLHADLVGLSHVLDRISSFHQELGDRWAPAPLLQQLAGEGRTFRDYDRSLRV
jgi:3-hydroxyacyl-CoA dehydrogenase